MDRRTFAATAAASVTVLAGCSGLRSAVRTGPPHFEDVSISGPDTVPVGEDFELTISAKNTGGATGDFTTTLTIGEGPFSVDRSVRIDSVPVAQTKSTTIGPLYSRYATEYEFRITDHDARHSVTGTTAEFVAGQPLSLGDESITIERVVPVATAAYQGPESRGVLWPSAGKMLLALYASVSAAPDVAMAVGTVDLALSEGEQVDELPFGVTWADFETIDGQPLPTGTVDPGEQVTGWRLYELDREAARTALEVAWQRDAADTQPEATWTLSPDGGRRALPNLDVGWSTDPATMGEPLTATLRVTNTGDAAGEYHGRIDAQRPSDFEYRPLATLDVTVPAGGSVSEDVDVTADYVGDLELAAIPYETVATVAVEPVRVPRGRTIDVASGARVTVENLQLAESVTTPGFLEPQTETPPAGEVFCLWRMTLSNPTNEVVDLPAKGLVGGELAAVIGDTRYSRTPESLAFATELLRPVEGPLYVGISGSLSPGDSVIAWAVRTVPGGARPEDVRVRIETGSGDSTKAYEWTSS